MSDCLLLYIFELFVMFVECLFKRVLHFSFNIFLPSIINKVDQYSRRLIAVYFQTTTVRRQYGSNFWHLCSRAVLLKITIYKLLSLTYLQSPHNQSTFISAWPHLCSTFSQHPLFMCWHPFSTTSIILPTNNWSFLSICFALNFNDLRFTCAQKLTYS